MRTPPRPLPVIALAAAAAASDTPSAAVLPYADTGHLYVSMWDVDEIAVFAEDGTALGRFTAAGLDGPRGLAFHPEKDELWVAGELDDTLHVFDGEHRPLRTVRHPDLDGPVGITFSASARQGAGHEVHVGNSDGDEILVLAEDGRLLRRFDDPSLRDPGCSALMPDGTLFVANRLGGSVRPGGAVARFGADEVFELDFAAEGLASTMAIARDPNVPEDAADDTLWVTSGAGTRGVHEFDTAGNLLRSVLPGDVPGGEDLVPQGIAFADDGHFFVVSYANAVFEFDGDGRFLSSFPTGPGTSRSTAFRRCDAACADEIGGGPPSATPGGEPDAGPVGSGGGGAPSAAVWALLSLAVAGRALRARARRAAPSPRSRGDMVPPSRESRRARRDAPRPPIALGPLAGAPVVVGHRRHPSRRHRGRRTADDPVHRRARHAGTGAPVVPLVTPFPAT